MSTINDAQGPPVIVIAGPTASGKSLLAARLAARHGGTVINADGMQLYSALPILSAQPDAELAGMAPHRLYGVLDAASPVTAASWVAMADAEIRGALDASSIPVVVGGTGLYLEAMLEGLAPIPPVPAGIRAESAALFRHLGRDAFRAELIRADPLAGRLPAGDTQRLLRAHEVLRATGRSLFAWQALPRRGALLYCFHRLLLQPSRDTLYAACDRRFLAMLEQGAIEELHAALALYDAAAPGMKALGVRPLSDWMAGGLDREEAVRQGQADTRHYAKRQTTWFRHRFAPRARRVIAGHEAQEIDTFSPWFTDR